MQRYLVQVQIDQYGNGSFSYMHNLINTWIFLGAKITELFSGKVDTLLSVKILTMLFAWGSASLLYFIIYRLTGYFVYAIIGGCSWFMIPGNAFLILTLEDNVWANFFNVLYIFLALIITGYVANGKNTLSRAIGYSLVVGLFLSIGINIHQQLVLLIYSFPVFVLISKRFTLIKTGILTCFMLFGYTVGSFFQNYFAFNQFAFIETFKRLWHQPYVDVFSNLWFFSSGKSLSEWIGLIYVGLYQSFISNVISTPIMFFVFITFSFLWLTLYFIRSCDQSVVRQEKNVLLILFIFLMVIHIPHSLVYEPWIVERWDATFPGLILIIIYMSYRCITMLQSFRKYIYEFKTVIALNMACLLVFIFSFSNATTEIKKNIFDYQNQDSVVSLNRTISFLKSNSITPDKNSYIVLDPLLQQYDIQSLISYYYPGSHVITISDNLDILFTSDSFYHIAVHNVKNIRDVNFPNDAKIFIMPRPQAWMTDNYPGILKNNHVIQIL